MTTRRVVFWDVDTQVDFIDPAGKLYVPGAELTVPNLERLTRWAAERQVLIVASACAHRPGDPEFAHYPPHCLVGTPGQQKIPETRLPDALVIPPEAGANLPSDLHTYPQVVLEKRKLDVFSNPNTEPVLARLGALDAIVLYGVVSEICVAYTARGLLQRGYALRVPADAIRALDEAKAQAFIAEITAAGARLETTDQLLRAL